MNNPITYSAQNQIQVDDTAQMLSMFSNRLQNCKGNRILDVGCAAGDVTALVLTKHVAEFESILGVDISEKFVKTAREKFQSSRFSFEVLDIGTQELPEEYLGRFDKVFSSYCLHLVPDVRQAYLNMHRMLAKNGDMFILTIVPARCSHGFKALSRKDKWCKHMSHKIGLFERHAATGNDFNLYLKNLKCDLEKIGFEVKYLEHSKSYKIYDSRQQMKDFYSAINPFMQHIPAELLDEFLEDMVDELLKVHTVEYNTNGAICEINSYWDCVTIHAVKL